MPRKKEYNEAEVVQKAMQLFWKNGCIPTSMNELEREMGINKFSIYSSFGDKKGLFFECMKAYRKEITQELLNPLIQSDKGIQDIETYFLNFIKFTRRFDEQRGCLMTNTITEFGVNIDSVARKEIMEFASSVRAVFVDKLSQVTTKKPTDSIIQQKANYLMVALQGLSSGSQFMKEAQLLDFIKITMTSLK